MAEDILKKYNYPKDRIEKVKHCIYTHRARVKIPRETIEANILASADALSHFECWESLLYLAFVLKKMSIADGTKWVTDKLERSWDKLMPEAQDLIKDKYEAIKKSLE